MSWQGCFLSGPLHDPRRKWLLCESIRLCGHHGCQPLCRPILQAAGSQRLWPEHGHKHCPWQVWHTWTRFSKTGTNTMRNTIILRCCRQPTLSHGDSSTMNKRVRSRMYNSRGHIYFAVYKYCALRKSGAQWKVLSDETRPRLKSSPLRLFQWEEFCHCSAHLVVAKGSLSP